MKTIEQAAKEYSERYSNQPYQTKELIKAVFKFGAEFALSNWISVEDALPEKTADNFYPDCIFVVNNPGKPHNERVFAGVYSGDPDASYSINRNRFSVPGRDFNASHWMYSPKPPKK